MNQLVISKEGFLQQYQNLSTHPDKQMRDLASKYIFQFHHSDQAWWICQQIIYETTSMEVQFIACQVLYRKTKESYPSLAVEQRTELRNFIKQLMVTEQIQLSPLSMKQVCSTWALILLYEDLASTCLPELVVFMQQGKFAIGLEVISQIAIESKELRGLMNQTAVQNSFLAQSPLLMEIFDSLLQLQDVSLLAQSLSCLDAWITFGLQILTNVSISSKLTISLKLPVTPLINRRIYNQLAQTLLNIIVNSRRNLIHRNQAPLQQSYKMLDQQEQDSLGGMVSLFFETFKVLTQLQNVPRKQLDEVWYVYTELICRFCLDYQTVMLLHPQSADIIQVVCYITQYPHRSITNLTFEFWIDFRQTLSKRKDELMGLGINIQIFWESYLTILQPMMNKCQLRGLALTKKFIGGVISQPRIIDVESGEAQVIVDSEDSDQQPTLRSMQALDFREYAKDIFYAINQAMKDYQQTQGQQRIFDLIMSNLDIVQQLSMGQLNADQFNFLVTRTEAAVFTVESILDDVTLVMEQSPLQDILNLILTLKPTVQSLRQPEYEGWMDIIVKTSLQLFYDIGQQFQFTAQTFDNIIVFILEYLIHPKLGPLAAQALDAIGVIQRLPITVPTLQRITEFFALHHLQFFSEQHIENFISGMFNLSLQLSDPCTTTQLFQGVFAKLQQDFVYITQTDATYFNAIVNSILSTLNWFCLHDDILAKAVQIVQDQQTLKQVSQLPVQLTQMVVAPLIHHMQQQHRSDQEFLNKMVKFFKIILRVCDYETQTHAIEAILQLALMQVSVDPIKKQKIWQMLISLAILRSNSNPATKQWVKLNIPAVNEFCHLNYKKWQDPDLVRYWVELQRQTLQLDPMLLLTEHYAPIFVSLTGALTEINQYEMQRELLLYLKDLVMKCPRNEPVYQNFIPTLIYTIFSTITKINPSLSSSIQHIIVYLAHQIPNLQGFSEQIQAALQQSLTLESKQVQTVREFQTSLLSKGIVVMSLQTECGQHNRDLKLLLQNLCSQNLELINYIKLEMSIKQFERLTKQSIM